MSRAGGLGSLFVEGLDT